MAGETPKTTDSGLGWVLQLGGLVLIAIAALAGLQWIYNNHGSRYSHDDRSYRGYQARSTSAPQYAPRRMEYVPQRQPQGAWRCEVGGRPGWCR